MLLLRSHWQQLQNPACCFDTRCSYLTCFFFYISFKGRWGSWHWYLQHLCGWPRPLWHSGCSGLVWWQTHPGPGDVQDKEIQSISYFITIKLQKQLHRIWLWWFNFQTGMSGQTRETYSDLLFLGTKWLLKVLMFLQQRLYTVQGVTKVFIQKESLYRQYTTLKTGTSHLLYALS